MVASHVVHALNFTQKAISHRRRPSHDLAFDDAILLTSYVSDKRADFLGRQQHVAFLGAIDHSAIAEISSAVVRQAQRRAIAVEIVLIEKREVSFARVELDRLISSSRSEIARSDGPALRKRRPGTPGRTRLSLD
jgi:hypothetical protein